MKPAYWKIDPKDEFIYKEVVENNEYQLPASLEKCKVLDIGGHVGCFARACIERGVKELHTYEPCKATYEMLLHNIKCMEEEQNKAFPAYLFHRAVGSRSGCSAKLFHWSTPAGNSFCWNQSHSDDDKDFEEVEITGINDAIHAIGPVVDIVKLDCEGSEYDIINATVFPGVRRLVIEFHVNEQVMNQAIHRLTKLGFKTKRLEMCYPEWGFFCLYNGVRE